jgi:hypothetical protein
VVETAGLSPASSGSFDIRQMTTDDLEPVLRLLTETFGAGFDDDWFKWKHLVGPWGASPGWVAEDGANLLGVRLFLPWRFRDDQRTYRAMRPCDTATSMSARGKGVFSSLTRHGIASLTDADFIFNTPNSNSMPGYLKMGFVEWGRVRQRLSIVRTRDAELSTDPHPPVESVFGTDVDRDFFRWRYEQCPSLAYSSFGLSGETQCGLICRIREWRGMRLLIASELWGDRRQQKVLIQGAAAELGARLAWFAEPFPVTGLPGLSRPGVIVTGHDLRTQHPGMPRLSLGDVEDVL